MVAKRACGTFLGAGARLGLAAAAVALGLASVAAPARAQSDGFFRQGSSIFDSLFGPFSAPRQAHPERQADFTRAPPPRKTDTQPTGIVLVLGDSMADWLAFGLEDVLSETPELGVLRRNRASSGLIRYDARNEALDWVQVAREAIAAEKPKFIVMMLGLNDRQALHERVLPARSPVPPGAAAMPLAIVPQSDTPAAPPENAATGGVQVTAPEQPAVAAPETSARGRGAVHTYEFRTDQWADHYAKRIDAVIEAMMSGGAPVFWVGLPSIRGAKATGDMLYLNDLYRTRAEKAGVTYIDVWDGFVDENGRYVVQGPDFEGQIRRLRVGDGVHFTKAGARKLARYVEREIQRVMSQGMASVALPSSEPPQQPSSAPPGVPTARPLMGPVVPLTANAPAGQNLLGGEDSRMAVTNAMASRVLVKGEAVETPAGRSDDFFWPRRGVAPFGSDPAVTITTDPIPKVPAPVAKTVPVPRGDSRTIVTGSSRRTTGRAPPEAQQRRGQSRPPATSPAR
jgi:hypothetical protein